MLNKPLSTVRISYIGRAEALKSYCRFVRSSPMTKQAYHTMCLDLKITQKYFRLHNTYTPSQPSSQHSQAQ